MLVTGIFCSIVTILLLLNFWQIQQNKPLDNVALKTLVDRLTADPNNDALKVDIRNLDLLARKAYFNSEWQVTTGGILLLFGAIVFFTALKLYRDMQAKIEVPVDLGKNATIARLLSQRWLLVTIGILFVGALSASYFSRDYLKMYNTSVAGALKTSKSSIQQVSITSASKDSTKTDSAGGSKTTVLLTMEEIKKQSNSFRGPFGNGVSTHKNIPVSWDGAKGRKVIWKVKVPKPGYNSPVIWNDKVFIEKVKIFLAAGKSKSPKDIFADIRLATGAGVVHTVYRAFARWPDFLQSYWTAVKPITATELFRNCESAVREEARQLVNELPGPVEFNASTLAGLDMSPTAANALVDITGMFVHSLTAALLNVSVARIALEGGCLASLAGAPKGEFSSTQSS